MCFTTFHPGMKIIKLDICQCKVAYCPKCFAPWGKCVYCYKTPKQSFILNILRKVNNFIIFDVGVLWNEINGNIIFCCSILILIIQNI